MRRKWWSLGLTLSLSPLTVLAQDQNTGSLIRAIPLQASHSMTAEPLGTGQSVTNRASLGVPQTSPAPLLIGTNGIPSGLERATAIFRGQTPEKIDLKIPDVPDPAAPTPKQLPKASITESKEAIGAPKLQPTPPGPTGTVEVAPQPSVLNPIPNVTSVGNTPIVDCETPLCGAPSLGLAMYPGGNEKTSISLEYLHWWLKSGAVPVLVTTGPVGSGGIPGNPGVYSLYGGGSDLAPTLRPGLRVNITHWFQPNGIWGLDGTFIGLASRGDEFNAYSDQNPLLARPFLSQNTLTGATTTLPTLPGRAAEITTSPNVAVGGINVKTTSLLWGAELNLRRKLAHTCDSRIDILLGYRYLGLTESLAVTETFYGVPNGPFAGVAGTLRDSFRTANHFHGAQFGVKYEKQRGKWSLGATAKIAIGVTAGSVDITGGLGQTGTRIIQQQTPGGLLALNSNLGLYEQHLFAVLPEGGLSLGYDINDHWRFNVGYTFMFLSKVYRPGDQIDQTLDITRIPVLNDPTLVPDIAKVRPLNSIRPYVPMKSTDIWAQGINFSLTAKW
jgi:hypothetical protein